MNTASRMETTCPHGCVQVSAATHALLARGGGQHGELACAGSRHVKGKGEMVGLWAAGQGRERALRRR